MARGLPWVVAKPYAKRNTLPKRRHSLFERRLRSKKSWVLTFHITTLSLEDDILPKTTFSLEPHKREGIDTL